MPCGELRANAMFFRSGILSYNLFRLFILTSLSPHGIGTRLFTEIRLQKRGVRHNMTSYTENRVSGKPSEAGVCPEGRLPRPLRHEKREMESCNETMTSIPD
jgi:hypothetical protein